MVICGGPHPPLPDDVHQDAFFAVGIFGQLLSFFGNGGNARSPIVNARLGNVDMPHRNSYAEATDASLTPTALLFPTAAVETNLVQLFGDVQE
jgi:hypothetical protein